MARRDPPKSRTASKELRRQQLIDSTIDSIALRGFSETTMANVAEGAGLSRGIVNFHFQSKDNLFEETLRYLAEEYRSVWQRALEGAGSDAATRLEALVAAEFHPQVCSRKKIAVWFAFLGEAKSRPTYREICGLRDREHRNVVDGLCAAIERDGGYGQGRAEQVARSLAAMIDGFWLDQLIVPEVCSRETACETALAFLGLVFPKHFPIRDRSAA